MVNDLPTRSAWAGIACAILAAGIPSTPPLLQAQEGSLLRRSHGEVPLSSAVQSAGLTSGPGAAGPRLSQPVPAHNGGGIPLSEASWTYRPPTMARVYERNDIVTIRVDELSRMRAEGNSESRRNTMYDAILKDWIQLDGLDLKPASQTDGDPRVQGTTNQLDRADASLESRETFSFNIAARIVDVRPNGDLVLEARKSIKLNDNIWETSLIGICRPIDIAADNVVLSRDLLDLSIDKQERGRLRDGYKRGWFTRWFQTLAPF